MYTQNNVAHLLVANGESALPAAGTVIGNYADVNDGAVFVTNEQNVVLAATDIEPGDVVGNYYRFWQRSGTSLLCSPLIPRSGITSAKARLYTAPVQQVTHVGYNGTTGSIRVANSTVYMLRLLLKTHTAQFGNKMLWKHGVYKSDTAATQAEIAQGLCDNLNMNFANETLANIQVGLINSAPVVTANHLDYDATVVQYSNTFTVATAVTYDGNALAVGDYIRLILAGTTTVSTPVYKVTGISGLTVTVDRPIIAASGTYHNAGNDSEVIPAASLGDFGLVFTGIAMTTHRAGFIPWEVTEFEIVLQDFGATELVYTTAAVQGFGYGAQIQDMQWELFGNWGNKNRNDVFAPAPIVDAVATTGYNQIVISWTNPTGHTLGHQYSAKGELIIAIPVSTATYHNTLVDILQGDTAHFTFADF